MPTTNSLGTELAGGRELMERSKTLSSRAYQRTSGPNPKPTKKHFRGASSQAQNSLPRLFWFQASSCPQVSDLMRSLLSRFRKQAPPQSSPDQFSPRHYLYSLGKRSLARTLGSHTGRRGEGGGQTASAPKPFGLLFSPAPGGNSEFKAPEDFVPHCPSLRVELQAHVAPNKCVIRGRRL